MICYESTVKIIVDVGFLFLEIPLFLVVISSNMIFYFDL